MLLAAGFRLFSLVRETLRHEIAIVKGAIGCQYDGSSGFGVVRWEFSKQLPLSLEGIGWEGDRGVRVALVGFRTEIVSALESGGKECLVVVDPFLQNDARSDNQSRSIAKLGVPVGFVALMDNQRHGQEGLA